MQPVTVALAGRSYEVYPPLYAQARQWRAQMRAPFDRLLSALASVRQLIHETPDLSLDQLAAGSVEGLKGLDLGRIIGLIETVAPDLIGAPDLIADLVFAYSAELAADRVYIEAHAYDHEFQAALLQIIGQAYPLGRWMSFLGPERSGTLTSSAAPNGASQPTASTSTS